METMETVKTMQKIKTINMINMVGMTDTMYMMNTIDRTCSKSIKGGTCMIDDKNNIHSRNRRKKT